MKLTVCRNAVLRTCFFFLCVSGGAFAHDSGSHDSGKHDSGIYAQLSSSQGQFPGLTRTEVVFENVIEVSGLKVNSNHVKVKESGTYFIMATGHAGAKVLGLYGDVNLCLLRNEKVVPQSFVSQTIDNPNSVYSIVSQAVLCLDDGDEISVGISSSLSLLGLVAHSSPTVKPAKASSIVFSMFKISK